METFTDKEAMEWCKQSPLQLEFDVDGLLRVPSKSHTYVVDLSTMPWRGLLPTATAGAGVRGLSGDTGGGGILRRTGMDQENRHSGA